MLQSRLKISAQVVCVLALAIATGLFYTGCSDQDEGVRKPNQPPRVWLSSAPPEGTTQKYTIQMFWGGWDPDGEIAYYEYAITNNEDGPFQPEDTVGRDKWGQVFSNDSTFLFTADELADTNTTSLVSEFLRSHTFFIRAVDREGMASREPAYRSFTARTLSPRVSVTLPPSSGVAFVPGISTYRWTAVDYVDDLQTTQDPESVSWILESTATHSTSYDHTLEYIRSLPVDDPKWEEWGGWTWYRAPQDSGKFWTTDLLANDNYVFAIRAKDEAGAITPVFSRSQNVRYVTVAPLNTGPLLQVTNVYMGAVSTVLCNEPLKNLEVPEGVPVRFCWRATADDYGGSVAGYRYGWDIENLDNPDEWAIDYTPFSGAFAWACSPSRTFFSGPHRFTVEVIDNNDLCARVEIMVDVVQFTMSRNLLLVDDYRESSLIGWNDASGSVGLGTTPSDVQHDGFWELVFENLVDFNAGTDVIQVQTGQDIPLAELADYKSIVWSVDSDYGQSAAALPDFIRYFPKDGTGGVRNNPNVLSLFMEAGGHVMISGRHPMSTVINETVIGGQALRFPMIWKYELRGNQDVVPNERTPTVGDESFAYRDFCLETIEYAVTNNRLRRGTVVDDNCNVDDIRIIDRDAIRIHSLRTATPFNQEAGFRFPALDLRVEATGMGSDERAYHLNKKGMTVELYNGPYFLEFCTSSTPATSRACFQPIYGLTCVDTTVVTVEYPPGVPNPAPIAFWTSQFADRQADVPGAVPARSVMFGFPLVYFEPDSVRVAVEEILFKEWQLPDRRN